MEEYIKSRFEIAIPEFGEKYIEGKTVTFYKIFIFDNYIHKKWIISKRYSEIDTLHKFLTKLYPNIPPMPGKTLFKVKEKEALEKRQKQLQTFLKECANREDIISNETFSNFLEIGEHTYDTDYNHPTIKYECDQVPLGIRDFYFFEKENILFLTTADMNIGSRIDSYMVNVNLPWEKKTNKHMTVGAAFAFKIREERKGPAIFKKLWGKSYPEQTGAIFWDELNNNVLVGLDSGTIIIYHTSPEEKFAEYEEIRKYKAHSGRIMGLTFDSKEAYIYSCSSDKKFIGANINYLSTPTTISTSESGYTALMFDRHLQRIFVTNETGSVSIFLANDFPPKLVNVVPTHGKNCIRGLDIDYVNQYIFTATNKGDISILELGLPGKEKLITEASYFSSNLEIRIIRYNPDTHELFSGDQKGKITVWSTKTGQPVFAWKAHKDAITQIYYDRKKRRLISVSKDKKIIIWDIPESWTNEETKKGEKDNIREINDTLAMIRLQNSLLKQKEKSKEENYDEDDSSNDSLNGWELRP